MITKYFNLYLNAGVSVAPVIHANQYDSTEQWIFTLFQENGEIYIPPTGAIVGVKPDGHGIINSGTVNEDGQVVINETQQMTACVGTSVFELLVDHGNHGTANFKVEVEFKPSDNADMSDSDLSYIQDALDTIDDAEQRFESIVPTNVGEEGDLLTNNGEGGASWEHFEALPEGGTVGQFLQRQANDTAGWADAGKVDKVNNILPDANKNVQTVVELDTYNDYLTLKSQGLVNPNVLYCIKRGNVSYPKASNLSYDNTESGLDATSVQGAIDENASDISDLKSDLQGIDITNYSFGTGITLVDGGVTKIGSLIVIQMKLKSSGNLTNSSVLLSNLPMAVFHTGLRQDGVTINILKGTTHYTGRMFTNLLYCNDNITMDANDYILLSGSYVSR